VPEVEPEVLPVPLVLELPLGVLELLGDELELLLELLGELPEVPEVPAPDVVSVEAEPETEPDAEPEVVPGAGGVLLVAELLELLLVSDGVVVVVPGVVVLDEELLLGVEPVLPLPLLLQPVAATEARAIAATRGIRCFMTSSPGSRALRNGCGCVSLGWRGVAVAASTRDNESSLHDTCHDIYAGRQGNALRVLADFVAPSTERGRAPIAQLRASRGPGRGSSVTKSCRGKLHIRAGIHCRSGKNTLTGVRADAFYIIQIMRASPAALADVDDEVRVRAQGAVGGQKMQGFVYRLGHQHAIERIVVMTRQRGNARSVPIGHGKREESTRFDSGQ